MKNKNLYAQILLAILLAFLISACFTGCTDTRTDASRLEYRTDKKPLLNRFVDLPTFNECYWKTSTIGTTHFGPSNYWVKGFIVLDKDAYVNLISNYSWMPKEPHFVKGIDPTICLSDNLDWRCNADFTSKILDSSFIGEVYFDVHNGILYIDVENL